VTKDLVRSERSVKPRAAAPTFELNGTVVPEVTADSPTTSLGVLIAVAPSRGDDVVIAGHVELERRRRAEWRHPGLACCGSWRRATRDVICGRVVREQAGTRADDAGV
jgi:hypothetical protein